MPNGLVLKGFGGTFGRKGGVGVMLSASSTISGRPGDARWPGVGAKEYMLSESEDPRLKRSIGRSSAMLDL